MKSKKVIEKQLWTISSGFMTILPTISCF